jgi:hypothetical protein
MGTGRRNDKGTLSSKRGLGSLLPREFDDSRRVGQGAGVIDDGTIDQSHIPSTLTSIAAVDMTENVQPRLDPEYGTEQVLATGVFSHDVRFVERAVRRFMGDEHVRIVRDQIPVFANLD